MRKTTPKYETIKLSELVPDARNSRVHPEMQINQLMASIKEFGFLRPLLIDESNGIIAGHGRYEAAVKLKLEEVPVFRATHLSHAQKRAYIIADNKLAEQSSWDKGLMIEEMDALIDLGFDVSLTGLEIIDADMDALGMDVSALIEPATGKQLAPAKTCPHCGGEL